MLDGCSWNIHSPLMLQMIKQGLSASSLLNRGVELMGENNGYEKYISLCVIILLTWCSPDTYIRIGIIEFGFILLFNHV